MNVHAVIAWDAALSLEKKQKCENNLKNACTSAFGEFSSFAVLVNHSSPRALATAASTQQKTTTKKNFRAITDVVRTSVQTVGFGHYGFLDASWSCHGCVELRFNPKVTT